MCQLLGMNCNVPTDICFSFAGFRARGGLTDHHRDGWGIAFFEGRGVRVFLDPAPSAHSPVAELVNRYPIRSLNVIAHIRKATQGDIRLENTHPFQRELWGRYWIFAHNGNLSGFAPPLSGRFLPVGSTDSERAFCHILDTLAARFQRALQKRREGGGVHAPAVHAEGDGIFAGLDAGEQALAFALHHLPLLGGREGFRRFFVRNLGDFQRTEAREALLVFRRRLAVKLIL